MPVPRLGGYPEEDPHLFRAYTQSRPGWKATLTQIVTSGNVGPGWQQTPPRAGTEAAFEGTVAPRQLQSRCLAGDEKTPPNVNPAA
jgi:hypothetical protein